jgi:hypothetical protein
MAGIYPSSSSPRSSSLSLWNSSSAGMRLASPFSTSSARLHNSSLTSSRSPGVPWPQSRWESLRAQADPQDPGAGVRSSTSTSCTSKTSVEFLGMRPRPSAP